MRDFPFAPAAPLLRQTLDGLLPPRPISTAQWAADHRWVQPPKGLQLRRWDNATSPWLVGIMDALDDEALSTVAIVGPAGCGKTMGAENWLLKSIDADPASLLWYGPTDPVVDTYVKQRIEPALEAHDHLLAPKRAGLGRDSVAYKRFLGMTAQFLTFTPSNLVNKHVARIVGDEVDLYDDTPGDPETVLGYRRQAAGAGSMLCLLSHPDRATGLNPHTDWTRGIMATYARSDRRTWWWDCPECGRASSPNPLTGAQMVIHYDDAAPLDEIRDMARLLCPHCGTLLPDSARKPLNASGRWLAEGLSITESGDIVGEARFNPIAGFWVVGAMNAFLPDGIGGLARAREQARREAEQSGDDTALRQVMVKGWGIPHVRPRALGSVEAQALAERASPAFLLDRLPDFARVLTAAVDCQANRFEILVRAWGPDMQSQVLHVAQRPAEPATSPEDWDSLLQHLSDLAFPTGDGRAMRLRCAVWDTQGQPGTTEQAYAAWLRARAARLTRKLGTIRGRDAWTLLGARGASSPSAPRLVVSYPEGARRDRKANARGEVPLLVFNPDQAKDALAAQLQRTEGPGTVHFPAALLSPAGPPHPWFEQLAAEQRDRRGRWSPIRSGLRNEAWDLLVMSEVAARLHGVHRINWAAPPAWAGPWDSNTMLRPEGPDPLAPAPAAAAPLAPRPAGGGASAPVPPPATLPAIAQARSLGARLAARLP